LEEKRRKQEVEARRRKSEAEAKIRKLSNIDQGSKLQKQNSKMYEAGVIPTSTPNGMPVRGSRDSGLDFDDTFYREAMSEMDSAADDYLSRDLNTDYSPSVSETVDMEDSISMPKKGVPNNYSEGSRSSDQMTVTEEDEPQAEHW
jgi:hypothetical protein